MSQFIFPPLTASLDSEASDGASSLPSKVMVIGGWDGANVQAIKTDAAGDLQIDVGSITPGTGATDLGKAIQSAQGATDTGVAALVVRNDTLADLAGSDHDYAPLQVNSSGALSIKSVRTLSKNLITSPIKFLSSFHSSYFSIFKDERQQTAVLSLPSLSIPVGKVISLHKFEVLTVNPANL